MGSTPRRTRRRRYGGRPVGVRPPLPLVVVVCDDTKTAVAYFAELQREVRASVRVIPVRAPHCGARPVDVLGHARQAARDHGATQKTDSTWVLLDTEAEKRTQSEARRAKAQAVGSRSPSLTVLLSNPCFEVWTLAHFVATGETFRNCEAVVARVKKEWRKKFGSGFADKKGQADYSQLMPLRGDAVRNARLRSPDRDPSWTEVHQVVEVIQQIHDRAT